MLTVLEEKVIQSQRIKGLVVCDYNEDVELPLPKSYSRSCIPARKSQIPRPESALNWPHLQKISEKIMPLHEDVEVVFLISLNCSHAIKPLEVIPGKDDDHYTSRTALGWGMIGAVRSSEEDAEIRSDIVCNHIVTCEVQAMSNRRMCHLAFETHERNAQPKQCIQNVYPLLQ